MTKINKGYASKEEKTRWSGYSIEKLASWVLELAKHVILIVVEIEKLTVEIKNDIIKITDGQKELYLDKETAVKTVAKLRDNQKSAYDVEKGRKVGLGLFWTIVERKNGQKSLKAQFNKETVKNDVEPIENDDFLAFFGIE